MNTIDPNSNEFEHEWKTYHARFEFGWRYFEFHAKQRTTMFNFFAVFSGFLIAACVKLFELEIYYMLLLVSVLSLAITIFFIFLDRRNEELVHISEEILRSIEGEIFGGYVRTISWPKQRNLLGKLIEQQIHSVPVGVFARQDYDAKQGKKSRYSHGTWIPIIQVTIGSTYILFASIAICKQFSFCPLCL